MNIVSHQGRKYIRKINSACEAGLSIGVDVYEVIKAFEVTCPATQHAIKKLLCAGLRGKDSKLGDLIGARDAIFRAIQLEEDRLREISSSEHEGDREDQRSDGVDSSGMGGLSTMQNDGH